jgi:hypothetical protein
MSARTESHLARFLDSVGRPRDPYDCWQEDGFWPDRADARLDDLFVWATLVSLYYINDAGMDRYLEFIPGRTLPEMTLGFGVLGCHRSEAVCQKALGRCGARFPRNDEERAVLVEADRSFFDDCSDEIYAALEADDYDAVTEDYCKAYCLGRHLPPKI